MTSKKVKGLTCGVFVDGSNLFMGQKETGWWIDFKLFKKYLKNRYRPAFYSYYGGLDKKPSNDIFREKAKAQQRFYNKLNGWGFKVITKPLKYIKTDNGTKTKCDMDIEISLDIYDVLDSVDVVILVSGDSDFLTTVRRVHEKGKRLRIYSFKNKLSWELKDFSIKNLRCNYKIIDEIKEEIELKKNCIENIDKIEK